MISPYSGEVVELRISPGPPSRRGCRCLSIQPDVDQLEVLVYVPSVMVKQVRTAMEAQVSPSTVRREEYGYLRAQVTSIADYPATPAALMRNFQNESLVTALTGSGPVTEVHVQLIADNRPRGAATSGRLRWGRR